MPNAASRSTMDRSGRALRTLGRGTGMKKQISNAIYGVLDYLAYPLGMLVIAPFALRSLGNDRYGVWMIAVSMVSTGAIVASGFGDANIRIVAMQRATGNRQNVIRAVRSTMGIHMFLGSALAIAAWFLVPMATASLVRGTSGLQTDCLWSLRVACLLIPLRAIESVCVSTQQAYERYGSAVRISAITRLLSLAAAGVLPFIMHTVVSVLTATALISALGVWLQFAQLRTLLGAANLMPLLDRETTRELLSFGIFTWIQLVSGLVFGQLDRLISGIVFGAAAVTSYALCVQLSQPIYGVAAAGLHFLFPRISAQHALDNREGVRRTVLLGLCANLLIVAFGAFAVLVLGPAILRSWGGAELAQRCAVLLPVIVWSTAFAGAGVVGAYSMLALGRARTLTCFTLAGGALMTSSMWWLAPHYGLQGMAWSRMLFGPVACLVYLPLLVLLANRSKESSHDQHSTTPHKEERSRTSHVPTATALMPRAEDSASEPSATPRGPCANVLGIAVEALNMDGALGRVAQILQAGRKGYVCAVGVHGILEALRSPNVAQALTEAALVVPDGTPTVWVGRFQKHTSMDHVTGPALMHEIFSREEFASYSHFFYGGKEGVAGELAANMLRQFPWTRIAGTYTPPFRELTAAEESDLAQTIRACKPDMIWVGIGTPRQDLFMRRMLPHLETRLMFGVGAAFDFHTGRLKGCPPLVKKMGLHWLHRLLQDPKRLWRRNLGNVAFLWHIALQLTGLKAYPLLPCPAFSQSPGVFPVDSFCVQTESSQCSPVSKQVWKADHTAGQIYSDD
jgi:exopolysaccharide biosynthesis WecB/TagA/CpsF family protein